MQATQLAELEVLYKEEQALRKKYFNIIEGMLGLPGFCISDENLSDEDNVLDS